MQQDDEYNEAAAAKRKALQIELEATETEQQRVLREERSLNELQRRDEVQQIMRVCAVVSDVSTSMLI